MRTTDKTNDAFKSLLVPNTVNGVVCLCVAGRRRRSLSWYGYTFVSVWYNCIYVKWYIESCVTQDKML